MKYLSEIEIERLNAFFGFCIYKGKVDMKINREFYIEQAKNAPLSGGRNLYIKALNGEKLTRRQKIIANCAHCMGFYNDGRQDCENSLCVFYDDMPYKKNEQQ